MKPRNRRQCPPLPQKCLAVGLLLLLWGWGGWIPSAHGGDKVVLQLRWDHQFQFAGYYVALWQGYYREVGLEVEILPGFTPEKTKIDVLAAVADGRADFGIGAADILVGRDRGLPLVVLASFFQQSAVAFYALETVPLSSPADLLRLRVGRKPGDATDVEMQAMLRAEGIDPEQVAVHPARFGVPDLASGGIDVVADYTLSARWTAQQLGLRLVSLRPSTYGVDFYGDSLFTRAGLVDDHPDLVSRFTRASIRGWDYAMKHPEEISDRIASEWTRILPMEDLAGFNRFQAEELKQLMHYPYVEPGHTNPNRWQEMLKHLHDAGVVTRSGVDMGEVIFDPGRRRQARTARLAKAAMAAGAVLTIVILCGAVWIFLIRRQKEALRDAEEQSRLLLESAGEGIFGVDSAGRTVFVNPAAERMLDFPAGELLGKSIHEQIHHTQADGAPCPVDQCPMSASYRMGVANQVTREVLWRRNGTRFPVEYTSMPIRKGDRVVGAVVTFRDITELQRKEEQLRLARAAAEQANRAKGDFLANMSHEIRTPMNAVIGMTHLALQTELTPKQMDYLKKIDVSARTLLRIINDILDFSKIEAGKLDIERVPFHLEDVLKNVSDLIADKIRDKGLELLVAVSREVPQILVGDPLRLGQILINLLGNAEKFTQAGEIVVTVAVEHQTRHVVTLRFDIRDTGIGMTPDQAKNLFEPFTQADGSTTRKYGGTGLGLTISKRLVELMGGDIEIDSKVGQGSIFRFRAVFGVGATSLEKRFRAAGFLKGMRVLVVDDSATSRNILRDYLETMTFEVATADSGEAALVLLERAAAENRPFPLVLMDWKMPGMDGIEAARRIKREIPAPQTPVIIMVTAYGREEIIALANIDQLDGFLLKPTNPSVLFNTIMALFGREIPPASPRPPIPHLPPEGVEPIRGARVLLVEDNDINRQVAVEMLDQMGVIVDVAAEGEAALASLRAEMFDLVLMDIQMPVMDGFEATRQIRASSGWKTPATVPIVAMTAHAMSGDREKSLAAGMNDHVTKPIDPATLLSVLVEWISPAKREGLSGSRSGDKVDGFPPPSLIGEIPGISVAGGLARVGGNETLYRRLLERFHQENRTVGTRIRDALKDRDHRSARQMLHTLKGVAGNIGASTLQTAAADLESVIDSADPEETAARLRRFESALEAVLVALAGMAARAGLERSPGPESTATATGDMALLRALLSEMQPYLQKGQPIPLKRIVAEINARTWPDAVTDRVAAVGRMVDKYRFREAVAVVESLLATTTEEESTR